MADQAEGVNLIVVLAGGKLRDTPPRLPVCPRTGGPFGGGASFTIFVARQEYAKYGELVRLIGLCELMRSSNRLVPRANEGKIEG